MTDVPTYVVQADVDPGDTVNLPFAISDQDEVVVYIDGAVVSSTHYTWTGPQQITAGASFPVNTSVRVERITPVNDADLEGTQSTTGFYDANLANDLTARTFRALQEHRDRLASYPALEAIEGAAEAADRAEAAAASVELSNPPVALSGVDYLLSKKASGDIEKSFPAAYICKNYSNNGTDDDVRFAVDAAYAAGGGVVLDTFIGERTINNPIELPSLVSLRGAGRDATVYKAKNSLNDSIIKTEGVDALWSGDTAGGPQYFSVEELTVHGNKANNSEGYGIKAYGRSHVIRNVKSIYCKQAGVATRWSSTSAGWDDDDDYLNDPFMEPLLDNVFSGYNDQEGFWIDGAHDGRMLNCIAGLNSHSSSGSYDGIYIGSRAGGQMALGCHSWGDTQRYAYNIEGWGGHYANNEADEAATALICLNAPDVMWFGSHQHGGFIEATPATNNKLLKGFVFGTNAHRPYIKASIRNCPKGVIDFTNLPTTRGGSIELYGTLDPELLSGVTGESTYGYQGTPPTNFDLNIRVFGGVDNAYSIRTLNSEAGFVDGSAAFPSVARISDRTLGMFFEANKIGFAVGGTERFSIGSDHIMLPKRSSTPASTWVSGMAYYDTTLNKGRVYDGSSWQNLW